MIFKLFLQDFRLKIINNVIQLLSTVLCAYLLAVCVHCICFNTPVSLFFTRRQDDPWQAEGCWQDISADPLAAAQSHRQVSSFRSGQPRDRLVPKGADRSRWQAQAQEECKPRRSRTRGIPRSAACSSLGPAALDAMKGCHFNAAPSLTLEERGSE